MNKLINSYITISVRCVLFYAPRELPSCQTICYDRRMVFNVNCIQKYGVTLLVRYRCMIYELRKIETRSLKLQT